MKINFCQCKLFCLRFFRFSVKRLRGFIALCKQLTEICLGQCRQTPYALIWSQNFQQKCWGASHRMNYSRMHQNYKDTTPHWLKKNLYKMLNVRLRAGISARWTKGPTCHYIWGNNKNPISLLGMTTVSVCVWQDGVSVEVLSQVPAAAGVVCSPHRGHGGDGGAPCFNQAKVNRGKCIGRKHDFLNQKENTF